MGLFHKKRLSISVVCTILLGVMAGNPAWSQTAAKAVQVAQAAPAPLNVRVINIDGVRTQSSAFKGARDKITAFGTKRQAALRVEDKALRDANAELNRKRTLLAPDAFAAERKKFEKNVATFQRKMQEQQKIINKLQLDVIAKINNKILNLITQYAEANQVTLILPAQSVLLRADYMDLDAHILQRLNKEMPSVAVSFPAQ